MPVSTILTDQFKRRYRYLRLSITDACNFRCEYCLPNGYQSKHKKEPLDISEINTLVNAFVQLGTEKIRITGGEPTIRKDLAEIIQLCKNTTGIEHIAMTSNGYRLAPKLNTLVQSGLNSLNISVDSLDAKSFALITGRDELKSVMDSINTALECGLETIKINAVLMQSLHSKGIAPFINLVKDLPITIRFIELMQTGDNHALYKKQHLSALPLLTQLEQDGWRQIIRPAHAGPAVELAHTDFAGQIGFIMPYSKNFCTDCNRLRVSAQGDLHNCLFHKPDASLRPLLAINKTPELIERIQSTVQKKWQGHQLEAGDTGTTAHLAMIGG